MCYLQEAVQGIVMSLDMVFTKAALTFHKKPTAQQQQQQQQQG
jgi:hypothetical protein